MLCPGTASTDAVRKPIILTVSTFFPDVAAMLNFPSMSVPTAEDESPLIITTAPANGSPLSSTTFPLIILPLF